MDNFDEVRERVREAIQARRDAGEKWKDIAADLGIDPATAWKWREGKIGEGALSMARLLARQCPARDEPKQAA